MALWFNDAKGHLQDWLLGLSERGRAVVGTQHRSDSALFD
jgi:hypothetical protein